MNEEVKEQKTGVKDWFKKRVKEITTPIPNDIKEQKLKEEIRITKLKLELEKEKSELRKVIKQNQPKNPGGIWGI